MPEEAVWKIYRIRVEEELVRFAESLGEKRKAMFDSAIENV